MFITKKSNAATEPRVAVVYERAKWCKHIDERKHYIMRVRNLSGGHLIVRLTREEVAALLDSCDNALHDTSEMRKVKFNFEWENNHD